MGATKAKTEFLAKIRLMRFLSMNLPNCWLATMTFHENVIVKKEAMQRWKPVVASWAFSFPKGALGDSHGR